MSNVFAAVMGVAETQQRRFVGYNARVGSNKEVHGVSLTSWLGGAMLPGPMCHVGIGSWNPLTLKRTKDPVTCARCLRMIKASEPAPLMQPALFEIEAVA